jgi:hypothetical protein
MPISDKDQKILWSRAAGRCSFLGCRVVLTLDPAGQAAATIGEMCHIVGKEEGSARSNSPLSAEDRDRYANLVLMCRHHHAIIDRDENTYPIEVLHQIKADHEDWVAERLGGVEVDVGRIVIASWIDTITEVLRLDHWKWLIDHAVRDLVHDSWIDGRPILNMKRLATVWHNAEPELEQAIRNVAEALDRYIEHFQTNMEAHGEFWARDRAYARFFNPNYHEAAEREDKWSRRNLTLLMKFVIALNTYADIVRRIWNPLYFIEEGRFLLIDEMGYRFADGGYILPDAELVRRYREQSDPEDQPPA